MTVHIPYSNSDFVDKRNYDREFIEYMENVTGHKNLTEKWAPVLDSNRNGVIKAPAAQVAPPSPKKPRHVIEEYTPTPEPYRTPMSELIRKHLTAIPELI